MIYPVNHLTSKSYLLSMLDCFILFFHLLSSHTIFPFDHSVIFCLSHFFGQWIYLCLHLLTTTHTIRLFLLISVLSHLFCEEEVLDRRYSDPFFTMLPDIKVPPLFVSFEKKVSLFLVSVVICLFGNTSPNELIHKIHVCILLSLLEYTDKSH